MNAVKIWAPKKEKEYIIHKFHAPIIFSRFIDSLMRKMALIKLTALFCSAILYTFVFRFMRSII